MNTSACAVYLTREIQALYRCGVNEINQLIAIGAIPKPLPCSGKYAKKRWSKSAVDRKLGILPQDSIRLMVREILHEELNTKNKNISS